MISLDDKMDQPFALEVSADKVTSRSWRRKIVFSKIFDYFWILFYAMAAIKNVFLTYLYLLSPSANLAFKVSLKAQHILKHTKSLRFKIVSTFVVQKQRKWQCSFVPWITRRCSCKRCIIVKVHAYLQIYIIIFSIHLSSYSSFDYQPRFLAACL